MSKLLILIFIAFISFSVVYAQNNPKTQPVALKMNLEWGPALENGPEETKKSYVDALNSALAMVKAFQPEGDNLFNWTGSRTVLANKTFEIYCTTSDDEYMNKLITKNGITITKTTDAMTILTGEKGKKEVNIFLCLLTDRIFLDKNKEERTDGFTRLSVALAHEIYGNTQMYLKQDLSPTSTKKLPNRKQAEINAFTAGINFINKVLDSLKNGLMSSISNKDKLITDFSNALKSEKASLEQWKKVPDSTK
jgi:hypothetical protein